MIGCEPTDRDWFAFAKYVAAHNKTLVMVNTFSVKRIKELDYNSNKKVDSKASKTIVSDWMEVTVQKVNFICCLRNINFGIHN